MSHQNISSVLERISARIALRRARWLKGVWEIQQSHIFILPNRYGVYMIFLMLASFAMGHKVQNNFILLAVIFLFLLLILSLIASVRNLQGLRIEADIAPYYFAGEPHHIWLRFKKRRAAFNIEIHTPHGVMPLNMTGGATSLRVPVGDRGRGVYGLCPIKVQTLFPFGIARAWCWITPPGDLVVVPKPVEQAAGYYPRTNLSAAQTLNQKHQQNNYADELGHLRDYQNSDPPARIDWKRYAATRETMVREHSLDTQGEVVLRAPSGGFESGLSYLSGGLLVAERIGAPARMILHGAEYRVYDQQARAQAFYALATVEGVAHE